uniref:Uncharacterized protein n=1 Tax=Anguilla anguilla TaxID=7936 RepID=A0A0E9U3M4_ANGAN
MVADVAAWPVSVPYSNVSQFTTLGQTQRRPGPSSPFQGKLCLKCENQE